jgi:hypothetical protein
MEENYTILKCTKPKINFIQNYRFVLVKRSICIKNANDLRKRNNSTLINFHDKDGKGFNRNKSDYIEVNFKLVYIHLISNLETQKQIGINKYDKNSGRFEKKNQKKKINKIIYKYINI